MNFISLIIIFLAFCTNCALPSDNENEIETKLKQFLMNVTNDDNDYDYSDENEEYIKSDIINHNNSGNVKNNCNG